MTKDRAFTTKDGLSVHHVRHGAPLFVVFTDDETLPTILHVHFKSMQVSKKGGLTREKIENIKRIHCDEIDRAFQLYKYKCE